MRACEHDNIACVHINRIGFLHNTRIWSIIFHFLLFGPSFTRSCNLWTARVTVHVCFEDADTLLLQMVYSFFFLIIISLSHQQIHHFKLG